MSNGTFVLALAAGAGLLAVWIDVRFPSLAPERLGRTLLHAGAAMLVLQLLPVVLESGLNLWAAIFGLALPVLSYALLTTLWMLRIARTALGLQR
jgi:hypothetical protein